MKTSSKIKTFLIIFFIAIFAIITARHFIGLHFKKKFSVRPAPGVIVSTVEKSLFYKSIETFGTAIAQNSKAYRVQASNINGKLNLENRFVKKGEKILTLKDGGSLIADFAGKVGKREIAQGVLGSESLIITLDDLKKIVIDIKVPENYVGVLKTGLKAEVTSSAYKKVFKGKIETISSRIDPSTRSILSRIIVDNSNDQNLKNLSKLTSTDVFFRGNSITCKGDREKTSIFSDAIKFLINKYLLTNIIEKEDIVLSVKKNLEIEDSNVKSFKQLIKTPKKSVIALTSQVFISP